MHLMRDAVELAPHDSRRSLLTARRAEPVVESPPRDCVRAFPGIDGKTTTLVGFDLEGLPQLTVEMATENVSPEWEPWILRWVRSHDRNRQQARPQLLR